ncbi:MAG: nucleotidyltransferase domain-containing protein [Deltaproteobacteria bacterium]|nr:nucleotidyltransferase domain-containing protein [Deltaproteobacteria bacterium]
MPDEASIPRNPYHRKALSEARKLIKRVRAKLHPIKVFLFGSVARGDVHELSNINLVIVADFKGTRRDRVEQILDIAQDLKLTFPVEPFPLRPEEFQTVRKRPFFRHIAREAVEV